MFLTPYQLALIAGGFTILGALLGNWISHRFSDYRDRRKERNDAAAKFRSAFTEIRKTIRESQPGIRSRRQTDFFQLFTDSYHAQYDAMLHFKDYLNNKEQEAIEKAWEINLQETLQIQTFRSSYTNSTLTSKAHANHRNTRYF